VAKLGNRAVRNLVLNDDGGYLENLNVLITDEPRGTRRGEKEGKVSSTTSEQKGNLKKKSNLTILQIRAPGGREGTGGGQALPKKICQDATNHHFHQKVARRPEKKEKNGG